jgi:peptidoglycan hydrolase-like protein with peptidoglycan-binding domain
MRSIWVSVLLAAVIGLAPSLAQAEAARKQPNKAAQKKAPKKDARKKTDTGVPQALRSSYAAIPLRERVAIQFDLIWTDDYNGLVDGDFSERAINAVKSFQGKLKTKQTGVLNPQERQQLSAQAKTARARVGWAMVDDAVTGARLGVPVKLAPQTSDIKTGRRWTSAQGQVQIETFRLREPGTTLAGLFEQQKKNPPNRKVSYSTLQGEFFVVSGLQGLKKFYVRASVKDGEARGVTILYDQANEGVMDKVVVAMSSAFAAFPGTGIAAQIGPPPKPKVAYGIGIVVTAEGHIITDRQIVDGCNVIVVPGHGDAALVADDKGHGLALLRIFGAAELTPAALVHEGANGPELTLVGIADPQRQDGAMSVSAVKARLKGDAVDPPPQPGFAGAAVLDSQGRFLGMVDVKMPDDEFEIPDAKAAALPAAIVDVGTIRKFLEAGYVVPATGPTGVDHAKASLVRVICVRK